MRAKEEGLWLSSGASVFHAESPSIKSLHLQLKGSGDEKGWDPVGLDGSMIWFNIRQLCVWRRNIPVGVLNCLWKHLCICSGNKWMIGNSLVRKQLVFTRNHDWLFNCSFHTLTKSNSGQKLVCTPNYKASSKNSLMIWRWIKMYVPVLNRKHPGELEHMQ